MNPASCPNSERSACRFQRFVGVLQKTQYLNIAIEHNDVIAVLSDQNLQWSTKMYQKPKEPLQLVMIKQLFERAEKLARTQEVELDSMQSILLLDLCIEKTLNTIISDAETKSLFDKRDTNWSQLWQRAKDSVLEMIPESKIFMQRELTKLHEARNLSQHQGLIPRSSEVFQFVRAVKRFLKRLFSEFYGLEFEEFRYWKLIINEDIQKMFEVCESQYETGNYPITYIFSKYLYTSVLNKIRHVKNWLEEYTDIEIEVESKDLPTEVEQLISHISFLSRRLNSLTYFTHFLDHEIALIDLGLPRLQSKKFVELLRRIIAQEDYYTGEFQFEAHNAMGKQIMNQENARFILGYLFNFILRVQSLYPNEIYEIQIPETSKMSLEQLKSYFIDLYEKGRERERNIK